MNLQTDLAILTNCIHTSLRTTLARLIFTLWVLRRPFGSDESSSENVPSTSSPCPACLYSNGALTEE